MEEVYSVVLEEKTLNSEKLNYHVFQPLLTLED